MYLLSCHGLVVVTMNSPSHKPNIVLLQKISSYCLFVIPNISPDFLGAAVTKQPEKD